jgi:hypothetical protein
MILNRKLIALTKQYLFWRKVSIVSTAGISASFSDSKKTTLEKISKGGKGLDNYIPEINKAH